MSKHKGLVMSAVLIILGLLSMFDSITSGYYKVSIIGSTFVMFGLLLIVVILITPLIAPLLDD